MAGVRYGACMSAIRSLAFGVLVVAVSACAANDEDRNVIVPPGGGPPGGGSAGPDAAPAEVDADPSNPGNGRVCLLNQLRNRSSCRNTGAAGVAVEWDVGNATTTANGTFSIVGSPPSGGDQVLISGGGAATSVTTFVAGAPLVFPAVTISELSDIATVNDLIVPLGTGGLLVYVVAEDGTPRPTHDLVVAPPAESTPVIYDSANSATVWTTNGTGPGGAALALGLPPGVVEAVVTGPDGSATVNVSIVADTLRFVVVTIP